MPKLLSNSWARRYSAVFVGKGEKVEGKNAGCALEKYESAVYRQLFILICEIDFL
jgi:hypothetical protein